MRIDNLIKRKWVSVMFSGNYVRTITTLLKNTNIKIAFRTNNTIDNILDERITTNKYEQTGIYRLTCAECKKVYIGQTGRTFKIRYKEHIFSMKYNREDSGFAAHILNNAHCYRKMEYIMEKISREILLTHKRKFSYIYTNSKTN
jgi:chromosome condensin MukBEF complex kleisin-like MukF subunit